MQVLMREDFDTLIEKLQGADYEVIAPRIREGAIVLDTVDSAGDLPAGWTDEQEGGRYTLHRTDSPSLFHYTVGPTSLKSFLYPSRSLLCRVHGGHNDFDVEEPEIEAPRRAFVGVRACELHAMAIQDHVFAGGRHPDPVYTARRNNIFLVAVNCSKAGNTCFCASMGTGPEATAHYDLVLTEVVEDGTHYFLIDAGTKTGRSILDELPLRPARAAEEEAGAAVVRNAAGSMGRSLDTEGIEDVFFENLENPLWQEVAERCLTCSNCTMACPTCFCSTVEDVSTIDNDMAERWRVWDSCFTTNFSYVFGGAIRKASSSRYRHWITHKLAAWQEQFGTPGCVGCGRCITWCPVGIDITEEAAVLRRQKETRQGEARYGAGTRTAY